MKGVPFKELTHMWQDWMREENEYFAKDNPKEKADIVLDGTKPFEEQMII